MFGLGDCPSAVVRPQATSFILEISRHSEQACPLAKARQKNLKKETSRELTGPGELFSSDISSVQGKSYGGSKHWLLVMDVYSKMKWSFFLKEKSDQPNVLLKFVREIQDVQKIQIKRWRLDNAGENMKTKERATKTEFDDLTAS